MKKQSLPTITQTNLTYLIMIIILTIGSALLQPILGFGGNTWINELVYILLPIILLSKFNRWSWKDVLRCKKTSKSNKIIGIATGISIWFFAAYIAIAINTLLDKGVGKVNINVSETATSTLQQILILVAMVVLAPICEEIFFRGFMQRAYEGYSKKYSFVITGVVFGIFHILNGIGNVFSATIMGVVFGYVVYCTGSIYTSMWTHAAVNFCAVFIGGALGTSDITKVPTWFHFAAIVGLLLTFIMLKLLRKNNNGQVDDKCIALQNVTTKTVKSTIILVVAILLLVAVGGFELMARSGVLK